MQQAINRFEGLPGDNAKVNLSAGLGDLANSHRKLGRFDEALAAAEQAIAIDRDLGSDREIAAGLVQIAHILRGQHRFTEADARYGEALRAAQACGDLGLQGTTLHHQGSLHLEIGNPGLAVKLYRQALAFFQQAGNAGSEMQACNQLGRVERDLGHLDAAAAWYKRSHELAEKLNDRYQLGAVAHNVGILHQTRAEQSGDPEARRIHLRRAVSSLEESLAVWLETNNQIGAASSYVQLGRILWMLDELDRAEEHLQQGLRIFESLNLPDVWKVHANLAEVARARGDAKAADEWQAKRDAKLAELQRLRRGDGTQAGVPAQLKDATLALARVAYDVRIRGVSLPAKASGALAQLSGLPAPLGAVGDFLRNVAGGASPPVPSGLPPEVEEILEGLRQAVG